jgi:hypothetical protein
VPRPPQKPAAHVQAALARTAGLSSPVPAGPLQPKPGGLARTPAPHVQAALGTTAQAKRAPGAGAVPVQAAHVRTAIQRSGPPQAGAAQPRMPHSVRLPVLVPGVRPGVAGVAQPKTEGLRPGGPRLAAPVCPPARPHVQGVVQRADDGKGKKKIPDDALPFLSEDYRASIPDTDITKKHKGVFVYQVTKMRNLPGIRALGLLANFGGSRVGLSQNPSQRESLYERSKAHSKGRVTVGTSSVVIDNYKKKGTDWFVSINKCLKILSRSTNSFKIFTARKELLRMPWLDDARLERLCNFPLEDWLGNPLKAVEEENLRGIFSSLLSVCWLNEPVILRFRSNLGTWEVDPDDPAGYQTRDSIHEDAIEVLLDGAWISIQHGSLDKLMGTISRARLQEDSVLDIFTVLARSRERALREERGFMGREETRESPQEIAEMMGL